MVSMQPALATCALAMSLALGAKVSGWRMVLRRLAWLVPLAVAIALINSLIAPSGSATASLGWLSFSLGGLVYGLCMGAMLSSTAMILMAAGDVIDSDDVVSLTKGRFPAASQMLSMSVATTCKMRRVASEVLEVEKANTWMRAPGERPVGAKTGGSREDRGAKPKAKVMSRALAAARAQKRRLGTILDISLDDSVLAADSMRARGWGNPCRSAYKREAMHREDIVAIAVIATLGIAALAACGTASFGFEFYPLPHWDDLMTAPSIMGIALDVAFLLFGLGWLRHV